MKATIALALLATPLAACTSPVARVQALSRADREVSAAVADQVRRCYRAPRVPSAGRGIVTRLLVRYAPDGGLLGLPLLVWQQGVTPQGRPYAGKMSEAARLAIIQCSPVRLPAEPGKQRPSDFYLTFSPGLRA
ncbi:MAG: hypothetical protein QOJ91_981 [Sphingomonadales bacterium]|jgi:hypothetical protein|nr:hypothetical protein [Sphingomonadales bacterium]